MSKRINFDVSPELFNRFSDIPWGLRSALLREAIRFICDIHDKHGQMGLGAILDEGMKRSVQFLNASMEARK